MEESDISTCRKCGKLEVRKQDGYFPDGRNKRFIDAEGKQWSGRACPGCVRKRAKETIKQKRANAKRGNELSDSDVR